MVNSLYLQIHIFNLLPQHKLFEFYSYHIHQFQFNLEILNHRLKMILIHSTSVLCLPNLVFVFKLKVHVEGLYFCTESLYFCTVLQTSTYGIHPLDFTNKYPCLLLTPIWKNIISVLSMVFGYDQSRDDYLVWLFQYLVIKQGHHIWSFSR